MNPAPLVGADLSNLNVSVVFGAGATIAETPRSLAVTQRPPLDRGYFTEMPKGHRSGAAVSQLRSHLMTHYGIDLEGDFDSLEAVMSFLYTDSRMRTSPVAGSATVLREVILDFNSYLAETTNLRAPGAKGPTYRLLMRLLDRGVSTASLTLITFNQDIQIEKSLYSLSTHRRRATDLIFDFPGMYGFEPSVRGVSTLMDQMFPLSASANDDSIRLFKLHGSLNWWTEYGREPELANLFAPERDVVLIPHSILPPHRHLMRWQNPDEVEGRSRRSRRYAYPVVVPPVPQKSDLFPRFLDGIWEQASSRLVDSDVIIVYGYSCPRLDNESAICSAAPSGRESANCWLLLIQTPMPLVVSLNSRAATLTRS